ncbi:MAG: fibronectin type III domain-containing protein, partial [Bacteroidales bacterium]|nr:fibronectin type III domain-containing protein [Bacteroidales bacterium]
WPSVATAASYDVAFGFSGFDPDTVSANLITGIYDTAYHVSNLMTGYSYEFYVRSDCGGSQSPWRGPVGGLIANHISMASGTNTITGCGFLITDDGGTTGNYSNSFDGTLVVNPLPGNLITISGTYNTETNYDKLSIYEGVGTSGTPILLEASGMGTVPSYVSEDGAVTIVFHTDASVNGYDGFELMLGCVPAPACMRPRALATNNTTATSTDLTWDGGANDMGYVLEWDTITNTNFTNANSVATSTNLYSLTGLTPNSQYHFRVLAICNNGDTTDWCRTPLAFTTTQTAATLPYSYDFEDPTEWAAWSTNSNNTVTWVRGAAGQSALGAAGDTMGVFVSGDGTTTTFVYDVNNIALYRDIDFGPVQSQFVMEFDARMGGCANGRYDGLMVFLVDPSAPVVASTSGITSPWGNVNDLYRVASVRYTDLDNDSAWTHFTCEFDTVSGIQRVAFFWFNQATSTYTMVGGMAQLDNLSIYEASCGRPVGLDVVDNSITTNSATLTWMGDATSSYIVTYREYYNGQNIEV